MDRDALFCLNQSPSLANLLPPLAALNCGPSADHLGDCGPIRIPVNLHAHSQAMVLLFVWAEAGFGWWWVEGGDAVHASLTSLPQGPSFAFAKPKSLRRSFRLGPDGLFTKDRSASKHRGVGAALKRVSGQTEPSKRQDVPMTPTGVLAVPPTITLLRFMLCNAFRAAAGSSSL